MANFQERITIQLVCYGMFLPASFGNSYCNQQEKMNVQFQNECAIDRVINKINNNNYYQYSELNSYAAKKNNK